MLDQAALTLKASNVFAGRTNYIVGPCPDVNRIVAQSPAAGAQAPTASSVELTVVVSCSVSVPDVRGQSVSGASATLRSANLTLGTVRSATDTSCNYIGTVMSHSPTGGAQANWGSAVNVTVGQRPKTPCP
jgi:serine/threonine-protein kinase